MTNIDGYREVVSYWRDDAVRGSTRLLKAIKSQHDFDMRPPKGWKPRIIKLDPPPLIFPPMKPIWFEIEEDRRPRPKIAEIKKSVCAYFRITSNDIESQRRTADIIYPRQITYYLCKTLTLDSYPKIGKALGGKDHSTVIHGFKKITKGIREDWKIAYDVAHIECSI